MGDLILHFPVTTLSGKELLPAGTVLTQTTMEDLIAEARQEPAHQTPLLQYATVRQDILNFCHHPPYSIIFADVQTTDKLLGLMEKTQLALPLLELLDFFKSHDYYTYRHILMVFALSMMLAQELIDDPQDLMREALAAPTHDFGKVSIPLEILRKSEPLNAIERQQLEHHSVAGYVLLSYYLKDYNSPAALTARDHHERKDGSGYPAGIHLTDRMVEIVAISDIFDALIAKRPYRPVSYDNRTALEEITRMAERGLFSWDIVQTLISFNRKDRPPHRQIKVSQEKRGTPPVDNVYGQVVDSGKDQS